MFWKWFGACGVPLLFFVIFLDTGVARREEQHELRQMESNLRWKARLVQEVLGGQSAGSPPALSHLLKSLARDPETRITLIGSDGKALRDSRDNPEKMELQDDPELADARQSDFGTSTRFDSTIGKTMMYVALRANENRLGVAYVRVGVPLTAIEDKVAGLRWLIWTTAGLTAPLALGLAFWLGRRVTRPLQQVTAGAAEIAAGSYGRHIPASGNDEIGALARTFNHMSERLAQQFAQLDEDRQQLRAVLSSMVEGVVALDGKERILFANERAGRLLDFPVQAAVGRLLGELVRQRPLQELVQRALRQPDLERQELTWNAPGPRSLSVHIGRLPGNPPRGIVLVFHDTSDLRRLERLRQEFVANVSHELKTPLSVITACVETLIDGAVDDLENRGPFLERIADQAERLYNLILDLLSLARLESATEAFAMQAVSLEKVVTACLERHRTLADGKHQFLEAVPPDRSHEPGDRHTPFMVWADEEAVRQILDNLVDNALKYTPEGGAIRVRWGREAGQGFLQVQDTGIGIPEAALNRVFERFYRVDKARARELGGTGLGLSIVKHLAQAMEGSVSAASEVGQGSTFTVRLPAWPAKNDKN